MSDTESTVETITEATKDAADSANAAIKSASDSATAAIKQTATQAGARFGQAVEEARAGVAALREDASERTAAAKDKVTAVAGEWTEVARDKGVELATQGKAKASEGIAYVGKAIDDSASVIDEKLGVQYGDYARSAARSLKDTASQLDEKSFEDLGADVTAFVRKSPATALGIAAVAGFFVARLFRGSGNQDA
ncbi:hypothetical protein [Novosphingobium sp. FKTRR1]|uniref:hypothetical protein n=1 Tax=Novosphingobium sp. FKTRR1 TaxID=2879118 RepID=UPI001CF04E7A|nr:hypothetical protein [Novosphingobium sp. FKTRR1]